MSASPSELDAANALASMLSNPSPSPSGHSVDSTLTELSEELELPPIAELCPSSYLQANMGVILDLGPPGLDNAPGFVPLLNSAPLTPTSLVSNEESDISTENAPSAEENEDPNSPREASEADHPEPGTAGFSDVVLASHGYRSPLVLSFADLPGRGTADSPYYVNTPPPGPDTELTAADRGPFFAEVVQERTVRTARRRIKERFHDYFHILDSFPYCTAARTGERRRSARQWLYREVMDEMDLVLADVDEVTMQLVN
ncbi:hypothetical protein PGT21_004266 [Puccinia graminis f. sp. tritici]|uniref:Uncharacterized protein n=1 Tax=Puccinia graminis f. sp. tritici TaxID=56615 RepID=A0A5B0SHE2_PUCGR|nr:hypothetical protein PGT21_004266 [Puccinia graminis f. sp. tritici]KAA1137247.1 hypothetical protein PGTUg99_011495 [Puccinia graminis f. sp. tritici]